MYTQNEHIPSRRGREKQSDTDHQGRNTPGIGAVYSPPPQQQTQAIPDIAPMRRGRPTASNHAASSHAPKPSPSPMRVTSGDPFAALDAKTAKANADELSSRFPTLDQFALLHDQGSKFDFDSPASPPISELHKQVGQQVANHAADDSFARAQARPTQVPSGQRQSADLSRVKSPVVTAEMQRPPPPSAPIHIPTTAPPKAPSEMSRASAIISSNPELQAIASPPSQSSRDTIRRPAMVSTGTMTSTPPPAQPRDYPPIHRFPAADQYRSPSVPPQPHNNLSQQRPDPAQLTGPSTGSRVPLAQSHPGHGRHTSSSRPSLEGGRPSLEYLEPLARSSSSSGRPRPASTYLESSMDYLREREAAPRPLRSPGLPSSKFPEKGSSALVDPQDETAIESNVDFLRSMEDSDGKKKDKSAKHHAKRSSLGSLAGTKNILAGKFGDAFKRFEGSTGSVARTPSPLKDMDRHELTPIAGSEATDGRSDDGNLPGEPEMTPEMRRELEAQSAAEEERRVEAAAAEYRQRMAERDSGGPGALPKSIGGVSRAVSIQNRVQNLLDESQKSSQQVQRTATGYGKFSDDATAQTRVEKQAPEVPRKPTGSKPTPPLKPIATAESLARGRPAGPVADSRPVPPSKPNPAPKPTHLNNIPTGSSRARSPPKQQRPPGPSSSSDLLVGVDLPGRPVLDMSFEEKEDYISDFSKRFPSLGSIEMVERDIDAEVDRKGGR